MGGFVFCIANSETEAVLFCCLIVTLILTA